MSERGVRAQVDG